MKEKEKDKKQPKEYGNGKRMLQDAVDKLIAERSKQQ